MTGRSRLAAFAAALALVSACSSGSTSGRGSMVASTTAPSSSSVPTRTASGAHADIDRALATAVAGHKRVLIDFGADWCTDCRVLDTLYKSPTVAPVLAADYVLVHVDVGHWDRNLDVSHTYGDAAKIGIPALVVLDGRGRMLVNTADGSFANARTMTAAQVRQFLVTWAGH